MVDEIRGDGELSAQTLGDIASGIVLLGTADYNKFDALNTADKLLTLQGVINGLFQVAEKEINANTSENYAQQIVQFVENQKQECDDEK